MLFSYLAHRRQCKLKQQERLQRIASLPPLYHEHLSPADNAILDQPISSLISAVQDGRTEPLEILRAYGKKALRAHAHTNCLTEIMIATAEVWAKECNRQGPLAGVPVSLKDTVGVQGWDSCIGYSAWVGKPLAQDSALIRLLRDAGAVPFVKTNIPITLLSFESFSDVFGRTANPHNSSYSPGGSTGGEAALLAYGGSRIGIGTDVAGSVRVPAHYSGIYTIKASVGRFLRNGNNTSIPGQEGVAAVYSPMARTLEDLETFWKGLFKMDPWKYDPSVLPMPWRDVDLSSKKLRWGVLWDDGVVQPSPACKRALQTVVDTLARHGHEVFPINPPSPYEALKVGSQLVLADGCQTVTNPISLFESNDLGVRHLSVFFTFPSFLRRIYTWYIKYIKRDPLYADLLSSFNASGSTLFNSASIGVNDFWPLVAKKEAYKNRWFEYWNEQDLDFVLTVPNAFPACPHGGMKHGFTACGYTFLFNVLDYSAGVLPITHVSPLLDANPPQFKPRNAIERSGYKYYNSLSMSGLPVGVQVVGRRLEEEKVMEGMKLIEGLLRQEGNAYTLLKT